MIPERDYVKYYISVISYKIYNLQRYIEELSQREYVSSSPRILIDLLIRIVSRFIEELRLTTKKTDTHPPEDIIRKIQTIHYYITVFMPMYLDAIETSDFDSSTASIIQIFDDIVYNIRVGSKVIIHPSWEYNASYLEIMESLRDMTSDMGGEPIQQAIFSGSPPFFSIITYPRVEDDIVLRQALIAHEVGHFFDQVHNWSGLFPDDYPLDYPELKDKLFNEIDKSGVIKGDQWKQSSFEIIKEIRPNWIGEIIADFIAVCILGPAYLFAFDEFTISSYSTIERSLSKSHPPNVFRLTMMAHTISEMFLHDFEYESLSSLQKTYFKNIKSRINKYKTEDFQNLVTIKSYNSPPFDDIQNLILAYLFQNLEQVRRIIIDELVDDIRTKYWFMKAQDFVNALFLTDLIEDGLIPTELFNGINEPPSFGAIFNAGWFTYIINKEEYAYYREENGLITISESAKEKFLVLQDLIAKASEAIQFKKEYNKRKGEISEN